MLYFVFIDKFIRRYGTHVVVSAKFGGEFKIVHTAKKSKVTSIEDFAQDCTTEALSMFSRSWKTSFNFLIASIDTQNAKKNSDKNQDNAKTKKQKQRS